MNTISNHWNRFGEKTFEDFGAKPSSVSVNGEIRGNLKVIFGANDKFVSIRFFSSVENASASRFLIWLELLCVMNKISNH